ncbi:unnamed protein product, partial [Owenia fusiformis]
VTLFYIILTKYLIQKEMSVTQYLNVLIENDHFAKNVYIIASIHATRINTASYIKIMEKIIISSIVLNFVLYIGHYLNEATASNNNNVISSRFYRNIGQFYNSPSSIIRISVMDMGRYDMEIAAVQCIASCTTQSPSNCVAVNFSAKDAACQLLSRQPNLTSNTKIEHDDEWILYTEKRLLETYWVDIPGACIAGYNHRKINSVTTIDACKKLCENEKEFECWSIDYEAEYERCLLSEKSSRNNPISNPCYMSGYTYAERSIEDNS